MVDKSPVLKLPDLERLLRWRGGGGTSVVMTVVVMVAVVMVAVVMAGGSDA